MKKLVLILTLVFALSAFVGLAEEADPAQAFIGGWEDTVSQRAYMDIAPNGDGTYSVLISWGSAYNEEMVWRMTADFDAEQNALVYTEGWKANVTFPADSDMQIDEIWNDATGRLYFGEDGAILWEDDKDEADADVHMIRIEMTGKLVAPVLYDWDLNNLPDGIYPVAFDAANIVAEEGIYLNGAVIFSADCYDIVDINTLSQGDDIIWDGSLITVDTVERDGEFVIINGGYDQGGCTLVPREESNCYVGIVDNDYQTYTAYGETDLKLAENAVYTDSSDLDADPVVTAYDQGIVEALQKGDGLFTYYDTTIRIENGLVVEIIRHYMP